MSIVYVNDFRGAANFRMNENNLLVRICIRLYNHLSCHLGFEIKRDFITRWSPAEWPVSWKRSDASAGIIMIGATNSMFRALFRGPNVLILTHTLSFVHIRETH